ncbi:MAG: class I SAM-dependent methyltransferase [bacterium]
MSLTEQTPVSTAALCRRRQTCRLCGGRRLTEVLKLAPTPPANAFVPKEDLAKPQPKFPLDIFFCEDCFHLQMLDVVDPRVLFENYVYVSGTSPSFVAHFEAYAKDVMSRFHVPAGSFVLDIGSNDGTLLRFFKQAGMRVLGVDPAKKIAEEATRNGIETLAAFFAPALADRIRAQHGPAHVVAANNVFAHIDDLHSVVEGVRALLAPEGVYVFEVSYLVDVYEKTLFDTIYHEHLAYHSVKPLITFFKANGMELIEAQRVSSHGGSLRGMAQLKGGPHKVGASVAAAVAREEQLGLDTAATFKTFGANIDRLRNDVNKLLSALKKEGKAIAGFGAPAKLTTLMHHFQIGPEFVDYVIDDSPLKQGLYTPGYHIPVVPPATLYERKPDYVVILAWNFAEPIMKKHKAYTDAGGQFIVPIPELRVL